MQILGDFSVSNLCSKTHGCLNHNWSLSLEKVGTTLLKEMLFTDWNHVQSICRLGIVRFVPLTVKEDGKII